MKILIILCVWAFLFSNTFAQVTITIKEAPTTLASHTILVEQPPKNSILVTKVTPIVERLITIDEFEKRERMYETSLKEFNASFQSFKTASESFENAEKQMELLVKQYNDEVEQHKPLFEQHSLLAKTILDYQKKEAQFPIVKNSFERFQKEITEVKNLIEAKEIRMKEIVSLLKETSGRASSMHDEKLSEIQVISEKLTSKALSENIDDKESSSESLSLKMTSIVSELDNFPGSKEERERLKLKIELSKLRGELISHRKHLEELETNSKVAAEFLAKMEPWLKEMKEKIPSLTQSYLELDKQIKIIYVALESLRQKALASMEAHKNMAESLRLATNAYEDTTKRFGLIKAEFLSVKNSIEIFYCNIAELGKLRLTTKHNHFVLVAYQPELQVVLQNLSDVALNIIILNEGDIRLPEQGKHMGHKISVFDRTSPLITSNNQGTAYIVLKGKGTFNMVFSQAAIIQAVGDKLNLSISK